MRDNARTRLAALSEKKPPTKAAQIRRLWPDIKAALNNGHSLKTISECLAADGIIVSFRELSVYVGRLRKKSSDVANLQQAAHAPIRDGIVSTATPKATAPSVETTGQRPRDPLANVREGQKKRSGFDYRPELADPEELI